MNKINCSTNKLLMYAVTEKMAITTNKCDKNITFSYFVKGVNQIWYAGRAIISLLIN